MGRLTTSLIQLSNDDHRSNVKIRFPTLVFQKVENLEAWAKLKDAIIDVGHKYTKRVNLFTSVMFLFYIIYAVFLLLIYFKVFDYQLSIITWVSSIMDILIVTSIILIVLRLGSMINESWDTEIGLLLNIKHELFLISSHVDKLVDKRVFSSKMSKVTLEVFLMMEKESSREEAIKRFNESITYIDIVIE
jgi:hypothetical protein